MIDEADYVGGGRGGWGIAADGRTGQSPPFGASLGLSAVCCTILDRKDFSRVAEFSRAAEEVDADRCVSVGEADSNPLRLFLVFFSRTTFLVSVFSHLVTPSEKYCRRRHKKIAMPRTSKATLQNLCIGELRPSS